MAADWRLAADAAIRTVMTELATLPPRVDDQFSQAIDAILDCQGRIVVTGLGKSGLVGAKLAASLASTGTPAFFVHAADALHGDAGAITPDDVVIAISNSGSTEEVLAVVRLASARGAVVVAMTGGLTSPLAREATATIDISVDREADPLGLAPTSSTTVTLALGDALVAALMAARGFTSAEFGLNHPGGALGQATSAAPQEAP